MDCLKGRAARVDDGSTQALGFQPSVQSLAGSWCGQRVWGPSGCLGMGMRVCDHVSLGWFQFLVGSGSWYPTNFPWSLFYYARELANGVKDCIALLS